MPDKAHKWTDMQIGRFESDMLGIYASTRLKMESAIEDRLEKLGDEDKWRDDMVGIYLTVFGVAPSLAIELARIAVEADVAAMEMANSLMLDVCEVNMEYMSDLLSAILGLSISTTMPSIPLAEINKDKDMSWNVRKMFSALMPASSDERIVESVKRRVSRVIDMDMRSVRRAVRTSFTRAESVGRIEAMRAASMLGIRVEKQWVAVMDGRTRKSHAYLDGQHVPLDEPFMTESGVKLMYPADTECREPSEVYNCRCTIRPWSESHAKNVR